MGPYRDVFVFDDYAIVLKETVNAVFFDSYRGKIVPKNLEQAIYFPENSDTKIARIDFWDQTRRGDYRPILAIGNSLRMYIYPFTIEVDPIDRKGALKRLGQTKSILEPSTIFT